MGVNEKTKGDEGEIKQFGSTPKGQLTFPFLLVST